MTFPRMILATALTMTAMPSAAQAQFLDKVVKKVVDRVAEAPMSNQHERSSIPGADVPLELQSRWGLSEAHCLQPEVNAPGIVILDADSVYSDGIRGLFGAPVAVGRNFMRANANYLLETGPLQRDMSFRVLGRKRLIWEEHTAYGIQRRGQYVRCRPNSAPQLR